MRIATGKGQAMTFPHPYRLRRPGEGVVSQIAQTETARFTTVAIGPQGTVVAGGSDQTRGGSTLYEVVPGATEAVFLGSLLADSESQVEDLVFDQLGRLHSIVPGSGSVEFPPNNQVIVRHQETFCATVNAFDPAQSYPFQIPNPQTGAPIRTPSTRLIAAGDGDIWLFGSDAGAARVADTFRDGRCPAAGVAVTYNPIVQRDISGLLTNAVLAMATSPDETVWFGTGLGLVRWQAGQLTPLLFNCRLSVQGDAATLERFIQEVAVAIFAARPLTSVAIGSLSFVDEFGQALVKEDFIGSLLLDRRGRLWIGTLGGGVRRLDGETQTLPLSRRDGLSSNIIFALPEGPDGTIWAATDEGVSRLQEVNETIRISNFSPLDGLPVPVRDVAVAPDGTPWLATDTGLWQITVPSGQVRGVVRGLGRQLVVGADILLLGTPFRTVTDSTGHFVLGNLPPGTYRLQVDGSLVEGEPYRTAARDIVVSSAGIEEVSAINTTRRNDFDTVRLVEVSGNRQQGQPGEVLPEPFVVRLIDQFGNPVVGQPVTAEIIEGSGAFVEQPDSQTDVGTVQTAPTDAQGERSCLYYSLKASSYRRMAAC